jgi:hypothetical protein
MIMRTYNLRDLLLSKMENRGISKKAIIKYYGHANTSKAHRTLENILGPNPIEETVLRGELMSKVAELLEIPFEDIERAVSSDRADAKADALAYEKSIFKPLIFVETEHIPNGIYIFGIIGGMKKWRIIVLPPDIANYPEADQLNIVRTEIKKHYSQQQGIVPMCGLITGYRYCQTYESSYAFDNEGECVSGPESHYTLPTTSVSGV